MLKVTPRPGLFGATKEKEYLARIDTVHKLLNEARAGGGAESEKKIAQLTSDLAARD